MNDTEILDLIIRLRLKGVSDEQIEAYGLKKDFVNQLNGDDYNRPSAYEHSVKDEPALPRTAFVAAVLVMVLVLIGLIFGFVMVIKDNPAKQSDLIAKLNPFR